MYTKHKNPGKYEGNSSQLTAEILDNIVLESGENDSLILGGEGYVDNYYLILGKRYGWVLSVNNSGFVTIECRGEKAEIEEEWKTRFLRVEVNTEPIFCSIYEVEDRDGFRTHYTTKKESVAYAKKYDGLSVHKLNITKLPKRDLVVALINHETSGRHIHSKELVYGYCDECTGQGYDNCPVCKGEGTI